MSALLELDRVTGGYGRLPVLREVSLTVSSGEIVALIGANGAGKSTLLNTVMGMVAVSGGGIRFDGRRITGLPTSAIVRAGIAQVPERRQLFGGMTVEENLRLGAYVRTDHAAVADTQAEQFRQFPILQERRRQAAQTLSGGEQQMLAIGRALVARPRLLLFDEPSLGLAPKIVSQIFLTLRELKNEGKTILLVEQNARQALRVADHGYVLERGRIVYSGSGEELLNMPEVQRTYLGQSAA